MRASTKPAGGRTAGSWPGVRPRAPATRIRRQSCTAAGAREVRTTPTARRFPVALALASGATTATRAHGKVVRESGGGTRGAASGPESPPSTGPARQNTRPRNLVLGRQRVVPASSLHLNRTNPPRRKGPRRSRVILPQASSVRSRHTLRRACNRHSRARCNRALCGGVARCPRRNRR